MDAVLRGKQTAVVPTLKKKKKSQTKNLIFHFKEIEKEGQSKSKPTKRREIKIRVQVNNRINETNNKVYLKRSTKSTNLQLDGEERDNSIRIRNKRGYY